MYQTTIAFYLLAFIKLALTKEEFFFRDRLFKVELNISCNVIYGTSLSIYAFIGRKYDHPSSSQIPPDERTNVSYLYGVKLSSLNNNTAFKKSNELLKIDHIIERSIYAHPYCNNRDSLLSSINDCNDSPSFLAIFSTGVKKRFNYKIQDFTASISIKFKYKNHDDTSKKGVEEKITIFDVSEYVIEGVVDNMHILNIKNNTIHLDKTIVRDPVNFILMNGIK